jgi:hypothetical protein
MAEQFANNAETTLASAIDAEQTEIAVASAERFPESPQFRVIVDDELMVVTGVDGITWTVERGAEGTTLAAHESGAAVVHVLTAGALAPFVQNPMTAEGDVIVGGASGVPTRVAKGTPGQYLGVDADGNVTFLPISGGGLGFVDLGLELSDVDWAVA